jgi:hypothetical protein
MARDSFWTSLLWLLFRRANSSTSTLKAFSDQTIASDLGGPVSAVAETPLDLGLFLAEAVVLVSIAGDSV